MIEVEIDNGSGFCFGVTTAISKAEEELHGSSSLYCLGDIVHNCTECERLKKLGVAADYHYYGDREHVLGHVFHCNVRSADAQRCNKDECNFFKSFL